MMHTMMQCRPPFCLILAALSTIAVAAPIAPPTPPISAGIKTYVRAVTGKDTSAYDSLLASNVKVTSEAGTNVARTVWVQLVSKEFAHPTRRVVVKNVFAGTAAHQAGECVALIEEISECAPVISECSPYWQIETLTFNEAGKVASINRSPNFSLDLLPWAKAAQADR
jgi:hypothetical protein